VGWFGLGEIGDKVYKRESKLDGKVTLNVSLKGLLNDEHAGFWETEFY